jgi:hypothetical protein
VDPNAEQSNLNRSIRRKIKLAGWGDAFLVTTLTKCESSEGVTPPLTFVPNATSLETSEEPLLTCY